MSAFPQYVHLGKLPDSEGGAYRNVAHFPQAQQIPHIAILRMDSTIYFANAPSFREAVFDVARGKFHSSSSPIKFVILEVSAWNDIDLMGVEVLNEIHGELLKKGVQLSIVGAKYDIRKRLRVAKFVEKLGENCLAATIDDAIAALPLRRKTMDEEIHLFSNVEESIANAQSGSPLMSHDDDDEDEVEGMDKNKKKNKDRKEKNTRQGEFELIPMGDLESQVRLKDLESIELKSTTK